MSRCEITGEAVASEVQDPLTGIHLPVWIQTDQEIHVHQSLLADSKAMTFLEKTYEIGERCVYDTEAWHARLRDEL